jgi:hypothetical protein
VIRHVGPPGEKSRFSVNKNLVLCGDVRVCNAMPMMMPTAMSYVNSNNGYSLVKIAHSL